MVVDGPTVRITGEGGIDLVGKSLNLTALAAPFKTIDSVVGRIPIIGYILGGSLVTVPVQVRGRFDNPKVPVMSPSAVSLGVLGVMKRTLGLPFNLTEALISGPEPSEGPSVSSSGPLTTGRPETGPVISGREGTAERYPLQPESGVSLPVTSPDSSPCISSMVSLDGWDT